MNEISSVITIIISVLVPIAGMFLVLKQDIREAKSEHQEEMKELKEMRRETDNRWAALFEKFHILDKDMEKFRIGKN